MKASIVRNKLPRTSKAKGLVCRSCGKVWSHNGEAAFQTWRIEDFIADGYEPVICPVCQEKIQGFSA